MFRHLREDFETYGKDLWAFGFWVMVVYRYGRWRYRIRPRILRMPFSFLYRVLYWWVRVITGVELPCETTVGRRVRIDHFGGIIISGDAVIGDEVIIRNGVTIGLKETGVRGSPTIGNGVDIGAGAKILGPIRVGEYAVIGANAVVIEDVPPNSVAVGVPARIFPKNKDERHA